MKRVFAAALLLATGCESLDDYGATEEAPYRGRVVGLGETDCADPDAADDCVPSLFRRGFAADAEMTMVFDPTVPNGIGGHLTTSGGYCTETVGQLFSQTPLREPAAMRSDSLALYDLPGGERVRNYIFVASPDEGPLTGEHVTVFLSLLKDEGAELRVLHGAGREACGPDDCERLANGECDYFGVFRMTR